MFLSHLHQMELEENRGLLAFAIYDPVENECLCFLATETFVPIGHYTKAKSLKEINVQWLQVNWEGQGKGLTTGRVPERQQPRESSSDRCRLGWFRAVVPNAGRSLEPPGELLTNTLAQNPPPTVGPN